MQPYTKAADQRELGEQRVNIETWIGVVGVVVGLVLAIPLHIAANLLMPGVHAYFEKRKVTKFRRSKEQELANYKRVEAFKNGTRDRYPFYILLATSAVICAVGLAACLVLVSLGYGWDFLFPNPLLLLAFFLGVFALLFMVIIAGTARQIERFEQYQAEIRKKWGEDAILPTDPRGGGEDVKAQP
jgi:hypothetical protein